MPQRPVARRVAPHAGDVASLVELGLADPPPVPSMPPPRGVPEQSGTEKANEARIQSALSEAGVEKAVGDERVIDALARLDPAEVQAVTAWLRQKKPAPPPGPVIPVDPGHK